MFKKKYKQIKPSPNLSKLDQVLWFIENFLPQKKNRGVQKNLYIDNLEAETKFSDIMMSKVGDALEGHRQELANDFVKDTSYETEES